MKSIYFFALFYGLIIFLYFRLPDQFWNLLLTSYENIKTNLTSKKFTLPYNKEKIKGEALLLWLQTVEAKISLGLKIIPEEMPRYKFYTTLLEQLLDSYRRLGTPLKKILPEIRSAIVSDLQFENKRLNQTIGAMLQFFTIAITTWGFVLLSCQLIEIKISFLILLSMALMQISGVLIFLKLLSLVEKKYLGSLKKSIMEMYLFTTLLSVNLPLNDVVKRSGILEGSLMESKNELGRLAMRVKSLITRMKETGISPTDEAQEILDSLWQLQLEKFEKLNKTLELLKFCTLAFFFLPSYFLYLVSLFKFFMEQ